MKLAQAKHLLKIRLAALDVSSTYSFLGQRKDVKSV